jgi:glyoxylase-like metal-dependent hydrolase (beta-lactamase superfamily II)
VTGDTLFIGNCGRTDLPGGDARALYDSLQRLKRLPDALLVLPGHDYGEVPSRSLGEEKARNPTLRAASFEEFQAIP